MSDEYDETQEDGEGEESKSIWDMMSIEDPGPAPGDDEQDEQDEEIAKEDKMAKKLSAKMDGMQKKFEATMVRERVNAFQKDASDLEKDLFKTIAADVKDLETLDKALALVHERGSRMQAEADKYKAALEEQAQAQVAQAWGTGPVGTPTPRTDTEEKDRMAKIAAGDTHVGLAAILEGDPMLEGTF
jgi:hypothetical protein